MNHETGWRNHGAARLREAYRTGRPDAIADAINETAAAACTPEGWLVFSGAMAAGIAILAADKVPKAGADAHLFERDGEPFAMRVNDAILASDWPRLNADLQLLVNGLAQMQHHGYQLGEPSAAEPEPAVPLDVRVVAFDAALPDQRIQITAMPARETTTTVTRDGAGNILKTTQTETDAT